MQHEQNTEQADGNQQDQQFKALLKSKLADKPASVMSRPELSLKIGQIVTEELENQSSEFNLLQRRALITNLIDWYVTDVRKEEENKTEAEVVPVPSLSKFESRPYPINKPKQPNTNTEQQASSASGNIEEAKSIIQPKVMDRLDISAASKLPKEELSSQLGEIVGEILFEDKLRLNAPEKSAVIELILADMLGLGPLEPLLADEGITDIMVNGPNQVYIEKGGKLQLTDVVFRDNDHVMNVARRIVAHVGRRVDETTPLCDARLADGSRVNIIIPPLAIDGSSISIRKFAKQNITLDIMKKQKNISPEMATVMKIASRSRLNILISGGTGSGKTTLLNALSQMIDHGERIVTIEDAAELQLQQPHVVRLETRPPNLEGEGAITMRDLVKNSLRMRPDRIILGEIRGSEAVDMLQAMNTGHDGSLGTVHANRPREALTRLENMVGMAGINLPAKAVRTQIADALDMIIQVSRMRDGMRRITHVTEVIGMEGDIVTTQDLFTFNFLGEDKDGNLTGEFKSTGLRPFFFPKAEYFSLGKHLMDAMG
ncbi:CpaF family protein [Kiloniella sp.]|uniref:CpaF family protein n=1 Tax=Kiloniella sp. TaxID=1938587 RepID=UPI003A928EE4